MHLIDWSIVIFLIIFIGGIAVWTQRYNKSIADFLAANRCAGRYLLTVAEGVALTGTLAFIGDFERHYVSGFTTLCWGALITPIAVIVALSGWVIYRFRQTKALTLAQFFEIRYNRKFRVFSGFICFVSGVLNIGILPGIGSRFFVYFSGLPTKVFFFGFEVQTFIIIMFVLLTLAVFITLKGGQIAIMVTDFIQGVFVLVICVVISVYLLYKFDMEVVFSSLLNAPKGQSMLDPLNTSQFKEFNPWFFMVLGVSVIYNCMGWQGSQGFNASAKNPHEARMGRILGTFRGGAQGTISIIAAICAYAVMRHVKYASVAEQVQQQISQISSEYIGTQMVTPAVLGHFLPVGLMGSFCAVMLFAFLASHGVFLHSWGSILVQDVLLPLRKEPLSKEKHMKWLRISIVGVAVFIFLWSSLFEFNERVMMYLTITNAIFLSGSGAAIIGGLYWRRGTTGAAFTAMIMGAGLTVLGFLLRGIYPDFPFQGHWIFAIAMFFSMISYIVVSMLSSKEAFNIDQMLHREKYAIKNDDACTLQKEIKGWRERFGISSEFTKRDIFVYFLAFALPLIYCIAFVVMGICSFLIPQFGEYQWLKFWKVYTYFSLVTAGCFAIWLLIGGSKDLMAFFKSLKMVKRNDVDDGYIVEHPDLVQEELVKNFDKK